MENKLFNLDQNGVEKLAENLAATLKPGDTICLRGDLGAGKTTLARAMIASLLNPGDNTDIPSPSFALVQSYETSRFPISHFDFYRINSADEAGELGLDEAVSHGIAIIEWPEKAETYLPRNRIEIELTETDSADRRMLKFSAAGNAAEKLARFLTIRHFLEKAGWASASCRFLLGDASSRRYMRLNADGQSAILMDAPKQPDGPPVRDGKAYSKIAHLAEDVGPFYAIGTELKRIGIHTPEIMAHDLDAGLLLLEDLGDGVFGRKIAEGMDIGALYRKGVDVLLKLSTYSPPASLPLANGKSHILPQYNREVMEIEIELLIDWYWPAIKGENISKEDKDEFLRIWHSLFALVEQSLNTLVIRDYHSPNLILLDQPDVNGEDTGVIDFQDAQIGNPAYDLVSLLQDARLDVPADVETELLDYYCEMKIRASENVPFHEAVFRRDYAILSAQRNTRLLGTFTRLAKRDGKKAYLAHIPRIWRYLERQLGHPELKELASWYARTFPTDQRMLPLKI